jgi:hypothetical protein
VYDLKEIRFLIKDILNFSRLVKKKKISSRITVRKVIFNKTFKDLMKDPNKFINYRKTKPLNLEANKNKNRVLFLTSLLSIKNNILFSKK